MRSFKEINEAAYTGNIGFEEMVKFYKKATPAQEKEMDTAVRKNDLKKFKELIKTVLGVALK